MVRQRASQLMWVIALVVVAAVGIVAIRNADDGSDVARAVATVRKDDGFDSSSEASESFARAAGLIERAASRCDARHEVSCTTLSQGFALTQAAAVEALSCTRAGVNDLRRAIASFLERVDAGAAPRVPRLPRC